ncbi:hypothetical protein IRJ41_021995 [Triplophysa rosa]|uniref:Uncharacterized protein n=1 Tax=Triplophysa rosa TaxID=992332 RepID=A0A9W7T5V8_TRIRA|nr:hypothetical protein IRJ41_021995 [Triplophysa rosa]
MIHFKVNSFNRRHSSPVAVRCQHANCLWIVRRKYPAPRARRQGDHSVYIKSDLSNKLFQKAKRPSTPDVSFGTGCNREAELDIMGEKLSRFRAPTLLELLVSVTTSRLSLEVYYSMVK